MSVILSGENGATDMPIKKYHVSLVYSRWVKTDEKEGVEIRHQGFPVEATDEGAAEWFARKMCEGDAQFPEDFQFNSSIAVEL